MTNSARWTIRPAARADLADIWRAGAAKWGWERADHYADGLFALFDLLIDFPGLASEHPEFAPPVRIHPIGTHLVIYRTVGQGVEIIRVLHARQDLTAFLFDG